MQYEVKSAALEAERVLLSGQNLYAVAVDGKAHLVPGDVFDLFFRLGNDVQALKPGPVMTRAKPSNPMVKASVKPKSAKKAGELRRSAILKWLEEGPLTTSELADHVYADQPDKTKRRDACWQLTRDMLKAKQVQRIEHNGIDKWALAD